MNEILIHCYIKIHCSTLPKWIFLTHIWFCNIMFLLLGDVDSLSYAGLLNANKFHYKIKTKKSFSSVSSPISKEIIKL